MCFSVCVHCTISDLPQKPLPRKFELCCPPGHGGFFCSACGVQRPCEPQASQNHWGWKTPLRPLSPTVKSALPSPLLNHVPQCHIYTSFKYTILHGCNSSAWFFCVICWPFAKFILSQVQFEMPALHL